MVARFGTFQFDLARRQLFDGGSAVHLTPKAFDLLALLIEAAPRVVPKAEIHERIWRGGAVSDATLTGLIKELRRALNDRDQAAPLIRTAHRIGYAFAAPILELGQLPSASCWLITGGRHIPLVFGENAIGRDPKSNVRLDDATVSRRHALIVKGESGASLEDLGSKNGTTVNGRQLEAGHVLADGDRISFGNVVASYRETAADRPTVTRASLADPVLREP